MAKTLMENLCLYNGVQGGTVHQYIDITQAGYTAFADALHNDYYRWGGLVSRDTINHYAKRHGVVIHWGGNRPEARA